LTDVKGMVMLAPCEGIRKHGGRPNGLLADGKTKPGVYTSVWNRTDAEGRRLANGVYFYALDNGAKRINRKLVLTE